MSLDTLDCVLSKVVFRGADKHDPAGAQFIMARTTAGIQVRGKMRRPLEGEHYRLWGEYRIQKPWKNNPPENAFEFVHHDVVIADSASGVSHYLRTYIDGLGPIRSAALVSWFEGETLKVLRATPELALSVKGITPEIVATIKDHFSQATIDPVAYAALVELFDGFRIPKKVINTLMRDWGSDAPNLVKEKPYLLLAFSRLGWKTVDSFATTRAGYPVDGVDRHKYAIVEAMEQIASQGHTWAGKTDIESIAFQLLNAKPSEEAWEMASDENLVIGIAMAGELIAVQGATKYSLPALALAEETIAERIEALMQTGAPLPFEISTDGLNEEQTAAVRLFQTYPVLIIAGPPGTGKTFTSTRLISGIVSSDATSIRIVTPTGKAAKRAEELLTRALPDSGIECSTIHRALGPVPSAEPEGIPKDSAKAGRGREEFGFAHGPDDPLKYSYIMIDEASMVDVKLGASLFSAIANGTRVLIVGDPNQLPSVGPGSMLRDLIAAGVPCATLTQIQRNSGRIVRACHSILAGKVPEPAQRMDLTTGDNWVHVQENDPGRIGETIVELHRSVKKNGKLDVLWDVQCISPEKRKPGIGCNDLNEKLARILNTYRTFETDPVTSDDVGKKPDFERGDKVIRTKNGIADLLTLSNDDRTTNGTYIQWDDNIYAVSEIDVVNGDMGVVLDIYQQTSNWYVVVDFVNPHRLCRLPYGECHLSQAYAVTCHKAQGSGFGYVIIPVHESFYYNPRTGEGLWNREMIYTLISRAETRLVTVGQTSAIESAVSRKTVERRRTTLRGRMAERLMLEGVTNE